MKLNPEQQSAVNHLYGPCIVTAVPGSGKTRVLTTRVINLIKTHNINPKNLLCLTFTNKAANEMKERVRDTLGVDVASSIWISTFHHLCLAILRKHCHAIGLEKGFSIYDDKDQKELIQKIVRMREVDNVSPKTISHMARVINDYRENLETFDYVYGQVSEDKAEVLKEYLSLSDEFNAVDFSGMLYKTWRILKENVDVAQTLKSRFQYIMVDEAQDTNKIQYEIVKKIAGHGNLFVVGDYCQSIFSWRGARPENLSEIKKDFENVQEITLPRNYRSTMQILAAAEKLIRHNPDAKHIELHSERGDGYDVEVDVYNTPNHEASFVAAKVLDLYENYGYKYRDIAVCYRTNPQSQLIELAFRKMGIPYKVHGGFSFFDRREVKTTLSYLGFLSNPNDTIAFARAIGEPSRKVAKTTIGKLERICQTKKVSMLKACEVIDELPGVTSVAKENLHIFAEITAKHRKMQENGMAPDAVADSFLKETGYYQHMVKESEKDDTSKRRVENVDQLILGIADFAAQKPGATISDYLHNVQIMTTETEDQEDNVSLMTIHSAKGLEFPVVFVIGCEDDLLPHKFSKAEDSVNNSDDRVREERRLMYVAVTRAQSRLFVSHCKLRAPSRNSGVKPSSPSPFIFEADLGGKG